MNPLIITTYEYVTLANLVARNTQVGFTDLNTHTAFVNANGKNAFDAQVGWLIKQPYPVLAGNPAKTPATDAALTSIASDVLDRLNLGVAPAANADLKAVLATELKNNNNSDQGVGNVVMWAVVAIMTATGDARADWLRNSLAAREPWHPNQQNSYPWVW